MPRSLHASLQGVVTNLGRVSNDVSGETERRAGKILSDLQYGCLDEVMATGLHAYLTRSSTGSTTSACASAATSVAGLA